MALVLGSRNTRRANGTRSGRKHNRISHFENAVVVARIRAAPVHFFVPSKADDGFKMKACTYLLISRGFPADS